MILRPLPNFHGDGVLKGTIVALDNNENPLGWEEYANWSDGAARRRAVRGLVEVTGITEDQARALITQALTQARQAAGVPTPGAVPQGLPHDRPSIMTSGRFVRETIDESWGVILTANGDDPRYYRMGDLLVHLEEGEARRYPKVLRREALAAHLDRLADYMRLDDDAELPAHPRRAMLEEMLAVLSPVLPVLRRISATPVLAPDGSCLVDAGYQPDLETYLSLEGIDVPPVPAQPTLHDVAAARQLLLDDLLGDFPFVTQADRANALAPLLTAVARPHISGPTPLHMIEAPTEGTGKGLFSDVVTIIATGARVVPLVAAASEEEMRKRITAVLARQPAVVLLDNLRHRLDSAALAAVLTAYPEWEDRELGHSRTIRLPVSCLWLATANNPTYSGEIGRRLVRVRIDAGVPCPWERSGFRHDPLEDWVRDHRGRLLWALLILARWWYLRGAPRASVRMGSYESWAGVIGGILQEAEIPGFLGNRNEVYEAAAAENNAWFDFLAVWWEAYQGQRVGVDQLFDLARDLHQLVELRAGRRDQGSRVVLGRELSRMRDRRIGDWYIRGAGRLHGAGMAYRLEFGTAPPTSSPSYTSYTTPDSEPVEDGEGGEDNFDPAHFPWDFQTPPRLGHSCTCPDPSDSPLLADGLPECPGCHSAAFWCGACGGCRLCVGRLLA